MERDEYFEAVQDAIEGLTKILREYSYFYEPYKEALKCLEWELEQETAAIEIVNCMNGGENGQA